MISLGFDLTALPDHEGTFLWDSPILGLKLITTRYSVAPEGSGIMFDPYIGVPEMGWIHHHRLEGRFLEITTGDNDEN